MTMLLKYYETLEPAEQKKLCKNYLKWCIRHDSCIGSAPADYCGYPHHLKTKTNSGMGKKPIDLYAMPMPQSIHRDFHTPPVSWIGSANKFVEYKYGVDLYQILNDLHLQFVSETGVEYD